MTGWIVARYAYPVVGHRNRALVHKTAIIAPSAHTLHLASIFSLSWKRYLSKYYEISALFSGCVGTEDVQMNTLILYFPFGTVICHDVVPRHSLFRSK